MDPIQRTKPWLILLLIVAIFTLPFIFAWFLYQHPEDVPASKTNHGYLITPPFKLANLDIKAVQIPKTNPLKVEHIQVKFDNILPGKWLLFVLNPGNCNASCQQSLHNIRQIRLATNAEQNRVVTAVLSFSKPDNKFDELLKNNFPNTYSLTTNGSQFKKIVNRYVKHNYALLEGAIYIADPKSHVILVYMPGIDPELIYQDLHHLLQVSQIG